MTYTSDPIFLFSYNTTPLVDKSIAAIVQVQVFMSWYSA